jgi:SAM-dependent methyltransferase
MTTSPERTSESYDKLWTGTYGGLHEFGPAVFHAHRVARRLLSGLEYRSVLDVGCGTGRNFALLCDGRRIDSFTGVDISPEAVCKARLQGYPGEFHVLDIQTDALPGTWDLVHCALMIHLVPDDNAALRNLRWNTGKYLLISAMCGDFEHYQAWEESLGAVRNYRYGELEEKLGQAGFRVKQAVYWGWPFYSPLARRLQNLTATGSGDYGPGTRLVAAALRTLYYLNSRRRGDVLTILAGVEP